MRKKKKTKLVGKTPFIGRSGDTRQYFAIYWREKGQKKFTRHSGLGSRTNKPLQFKIVMKRHKRVKP